MVQGVWLVLGLLIEEEKSFTALTFPVLHKVLDFVEFASGSLFPEVDIG